MTQHTETATPRTDARFLEIERDYDCKFIIEGAWAAAKWYSQALERELAALQAKLDAAAIACNDALTAANKCLLAEMEINKTLRTQLAQAQNEALERAAQACYSCCSTFASDMAMDAARACAEKIRELKPPNSAEGEPG